MRARLRGPQGLRQRGIVSLETKERGIEMQIGGVNKCQRLHATNCKPKQHAYEEKVMGEQNQESTPVLPEHTRNQ